MQLDSNQGRAKHRISSYGILKGVNIALGVISGFYVPYVLVSSCTESTTALMLTYFGVSSLFLLLDFGITKPIFNLLKNSIEKSKILSYIFPVFLCLFLVMIIAVSVTFLIYKNVYSSQLNILTIICYALAVSIAAIISMLKPVLAAIDEYIYFEKMEMMRRIGTIVAFTFLLVSSNILLAVFVMLLLNTMCLIMALKVSESITINLNLMPAFRFFWNTIGRDARSNWLFTICELLIYNAGYYVLPFIASNQFIISYGIYMRFLTGIYMVIRFYPDTVLWRLVDSEGKQEFNKAIIINFALSGVIIGFYMLISGPIITTLFSIDYLNETLYIYVIIYAIGNTLRHLPGGLLTYKFRMYKWVSRISLLEAVGVMFFCSLLYTTGNLFYILFWAIIYLFFSLWIVNRTYRLI